MNYLSKKRTRLREIDFEKVEDIRLKLKMSNNDMAELLGLFVQVDKNGNKKGSAQYYNYRKCGKVPADRYYGARDSIILSRHQELDDDLKEIRELFA